MLEAGATGYVLKQAVDTELAVAIRAVQRGEVFLYSSFSRILLGDLASKEEAQGEHSKLDSYERLSQREREVLRLVALGHTNQQIADQLYLSVKTVETYRARVMDKLDLKSRTALVRYALQRGLLDEERGESPGLT
jgi:two-component system response regulator NreC